MKKIVSLAAFIALCAPLSAQEIKSSPAYDNVQHEQTLKKWNSPQQMADPGATNNTTHTNTRKLTGTDPLNLHDHTIGGTAKKDTTTKKFLKKK